MTAPMPAIATLFAIPLIEGGIGALLLMSGAAKLAQHKTFIGTLAAYRLLPRATPPIVFDGLAWAVGIVEMALGCGMLVGAVACDRCAGLLFGVFAVALAINVARGRTSIDCGCMIGAKAAGLSWGTVLRALGLGGLAALPTAMASHGAPAWDMIGVHAAGALLWLLWLAVSAPAGPAKPVAGAA